MATLKYAYAGAGVKDDTSVSVQNLLIYYPDDGNNHKYVIFSGGSKGFLLVLKNYPLSELKIFFCCSVALTTRSNSLANFTCISRTL